MVCTVQCCTLLSVVQHTCTLQDVVVQVSKREGRASSACGRGSLLTAPVCHPTQCSLHIPTEQMKCLYLQAPSLTAVTATNTTTAWHCFVCAGIKLQHKVMGIRVHAVT